MPSSHLPTSPTRSKEDHQTSGSVTLLQCNDYGVAFLVVAHCVAECSERKPRQGTGGSSTQCCQALPASSSRRAPNLLLLPHSQPLQSTAPLQVEALSAVQCFAVKTACNLQYMADVCPRRCLGRPGTCPRRRGTTWGQKKTSALPCPSSNITF